MTGTISFFDSVRRFGFVAIEADTRMAEYYFHASDVLGPTMPQKRDTVDFWLGESPTRGNWQAVEVTVRAPLQLTPE
jgi:cold shock CspA family protein